MLLSLFFPNVVNRGRGLLCVFFRFLVLRQAFLSSQQHVSYLFQIWLPVFNLNIWLYLSNEFHLDLFKHINVLHKPIHRSDTGNICDKSQIRKAHIYIYICLTFLSILFCWCWYCSCCYYVLVFRIVFRTCLFTRLQNDLNNLGYHNCLTVFMLEIYH